MLNVKSQMPNAQMLKRQMLNVKCCLNVKCSNAQFNQILKCQMLKCSNAMQWVYSGMCTCMCMRRTNQQTANLFVFVLCSSTRLVLDYNTIRTVQQPFKHPEQRDWYPVRDKVAEQCVAVQTPVVHVQIFDPRLRCAFDVGNEALILDYLADRFEQEQQKTHHAVWQETRCERKQQQRCEA